MIITPVKHFNVARRDGATVAAGAVAKFPRRPGASVLNETIPLFYIGRNKNRLWVAREEAGRTGGIFLFKRSALRFATKHSAPVGCATMFLDEPFELDVENRGSSLVVDLDIAMGIAARRAPRLAAFISTAVESVRKLLAVDAPRKGRVV